MGIWEIDAWKLVLAGGPIMAPILLCSFLALAIIIEKLIYFSLISTNTNKLKKTVFALVKDNKIKEAIELCDSRRSPVAKILKAGIKIFEFRPDPEIQKQLIDRYAALEKLAPKFAIHAKTMVIDGSLLFIGTFNLDPRSANLNTEVGVFINNQKLASQVESTILTDMKSGNSWDASVDLPDRYASILKRLKISFYKSFPMRDIL